MESNRVVCPKCGGPVPAGASEGLCTRCLLEAATLPTEGGGAPGAGAGGRAAPASLERVATAFPHLEVVELVGVGGMGAVYKARQPKLDRWVALKLLPEPMGREPAFAERFLREARTLARLSHPHIVAVHDFGQADGFFYLLMEYVDGVNLRQAMRAGRFSPAQALLLVPQICEALQFAHDHGVMHRDIKPENILLDARGRVKLADFGIAKLLGQGGPEPGLTVTGAAVGTPQYMAPEQIERPGDVDHRADIYSLGVVFYELLTGELPLGRFSPPSSKTPMDARVDDIVLRALAKERELRQQSADEMRTAVEGVRTPPPASTPAAPAPGRDPGPQPVADRTPAGWAPTPRLQLVMLAVLSAYALAAVLELRTRGGGLIDSIRSAVNAGGFPLLAAFLGVAGCAWAAVVALRGEDAWLHPLRRFPARGDSTAGGEVTERGIRYSLLVLLACQAGSVTSLFISSLVSLGFMAKAPGTWLPGLWIASGPVALACAWVRGWREARRPDAGRGGAMPGWAGRVALGLAAFGLLATVAVVWRRQEPVTVLQEQATVLFGNGEFVLPVCVALWTRSRFWRGVGEVLALYAAILAFVGVVGIGYLATQDPASLASQGFSGEALGHPFRMILTELEGLAVFGLALWTLWTPAVRRAFGPGTRPPGTSPAAVPVPAPLASPLS